MEVFETSFLIRDNLCNTNKCPHFSPVFLKINCSEMINFLGYDNFMYIPAGGGYQKCERMLIPHTLSITYTMVPQ
jgi:hypothetical protein